MDPVTNPFAPGAGNPPPRLPGRDVLLDAVQVAVKRAKLGRPAKSVLLVGLRGVGKTVLLDRMRDNAEADGVHTLRMEAGEPFPAERSWHLSYGKRCYAFRGIESEGPCPTRAARTGRFRPRTEGEVPRH